MGRFRNFKPDEWADEISAGLDYRRKFGIERAWPELEAMYYNVHKSMSNDGPNLIMSTGDAMMSSLVVPNPAIMVKASQAEAVPKAPLVESMDNTLLREIGIRDEIETATLNAYIMGVGIVKIGYDSEYGFDPDYDIGGILHTGLTLTQYSEGGNRRIETSGRIAPGMPWVKSIDPRDFVVPWGTQWIISSPWVAHRFVRQIDDLRADPKYDNVDRLEPSLSMEDFVESYKSTVRLWRPNTSATSTSSRPRSRKYSNRDKAHRQVQFVELYEIHDRRTGRIMVIAPDYDKYLRNDINALQIDNLLPFASISFTPKCRAFWTTPDAYYLQAIQMEISDLAIQRTKIRRLAVVKFLYDENVIDEVELEKLLSPDVGAAAKIKNAGKIDEAIKEIRTTIDQNLILEEEHLRRNAREQVGFSRNQLGEFSGGRRTATEAKIVDVSSARRISRRELVVATLYENVIKIINGIVFEHWTLPRYVEVIGPTAAQTWQMITGPQLKARYSYKVIFTDDEALRARRIEALQLYTYLSQDPSIDPIALRQYIADNFNDPSFERLFNATIQHAMRAMRIAGGLAQQQSIGPPGAGGAIGGGAGQAGGSALPELPFSVPGLSAGGGGGGASRSGGGSSSRRSSNGQGRSRSTQTAKRT